MNEEELHEALLKAFREYYKANLLWKERDSRKTAVVTRNWLSEIRRLCSLRRKLIQEWRHTTWEEKLGRRPHKYSKNNPDEENNDN